MLTVWSRVRPKPSLKPQDQTQQGVREIEYWGSPLELVGSACLGIFTSGVEAQMNRVALLSIKAEFQF